MLDALTTSFAERFPLRHFGSNEVLFRAGEVKTHLFLIESGSVSVHQTRNCRSPAVIEFAFPGDVLGLGFLKTHIDEARAAMPTAARSLPLSMLDNLIEEDDRTRQRYAEAVRREFAFRRTQLTGAAERSPLARVAAFLVALSFFNKHEGLDHSIVSDTLDCGVVADWLGLDLHALSRALVELESSGAIDQLPPNALRIVDIPLLEELAYAPNFVAPEQPRKVALKQVVGELLHGQTA